MGLVSTASPEVDSGLDTTLDPDQITVLTTPWVTIVWNDPTSALSLETSLAPGALASLVCDASAESRALVISSASSDLIDRCFERRSSEASGVELKGVEGGH